MSDTVTSPGAVKFLKLCFALPHINNADTVIRLGHPM